MTENQQTGYFAKLWQVLPESLKRTVRAIRAQWHGDLYDEFQRREEAPAHGKDEEKAPSSALLQEISRQLEACGPDQELSKRVDALFELVAGTLKQVNEQSAAHMNTMKQVNEQLAAHLNTMAEWHRANLCNQISLANKRQGRRTIFTPWNSNQSFKLIMLENGQLCFFYPPAKLASSQRRIFVNTIPKAGTYFLAAVLRSLGYRSTGAHGADNEYTDGDGTVELPFEIQLGLIHEDQYHLAHMSYDGAVKARQHGFDKILIVVRDLRHVMVSLMRHTHRTNTGASEWLPVNSYTANDLLVFLNENAFLFSFPLMVAQACLDLHKENYGCLVRFEEITSHDKEKMMPSLQAISEVTGCSVDDIFKAVEEKYDTKTGTFTGDHVTLDNIWTKEVEDLFIAKGGDVLNEKLGYPREYIPKN